MKRFKYNLSHYKLLSCDMGELIPVSCVDVLPGDTFDHQTNILLRVSPMLSPVMHPVQVRLHHFFVPYRLLWNASIIDSWEAFIMNRVGTPPVFPTISLVAPGQGQLADYLGVPVTAATIAVSALPFRAYNLIYNEFYRDQDISPAADISTSGGVDGLTARTLHKVIWEKDYFTTARPWPARTADVTVPISTSGQDIQVRRSGDPNADRSLQMDATGKVSVSGTLPAGIELLRFGSQEGLMNLNIRDLRESFALQRFAENRARLGSRYTEYLRFLGVRPSDSRLQRPEFLGGGRKTIAFSEVLQTAEGTNPVGEMRGHGISALRSNRYRRFFEEHGIVMSLLSVRPKSMYVEGLHRSWSKRTFDEYYQKELKDIGMQELYSKELFAEAEPAGSTVFGWQDRYEEYRRHPSNVAGEFRSSLMNDWHMARSFASAPVLNTSFLDCVPTKRIHAVQTNDVLWVMAYHRLRARRIVARAATGRVL